MKKLYYKAVMEAVSPLKTASGIEDKSDSDILTDSDGNPFIPGTTLAGVIRHHIESIITTDDVNSWFGYTVPKKDEGENSRITFYDAFYVKDEPKPKLSRRDGVRLSNHKETIQRGKYDYEIVEKGATFEFRFEVDTDNAADFKEIADRIFNGFNSGKILVGGKTTRGFGNVKLNDIRLCVIDNADDYINFEWEKSEFTRYKPEKTTETALFETIDYTFKITAFLHIRDYATHVTNPDTGNVVNSEQLKGGDGKPVIPGTSWAGLFRHHSKKILTAAGEEEKDADELINNWFGYLGNDKKRISVSKVSFTESEIDGSTQLVRTRNAIDRFTGGAGDKKLFTDEMSFGGNGKLTIKIKKDAQDFELLKSVIKACIEDINEGIAAVGGATAIGGGILKEVSK